MKPLPTAIAVTALWTVAPAAFACTLCDSATAAQVRAAVLGPQLLENLAGLAAPLPALALAILAVHRLTR